MARLRTSSDGEGTLFKNISFFVLQRIPTRSQIVNQIECNGGKVVKLEKHADIQIADHARKDSPAGSISWTWVEDSVKNARLANKEDHRAGARVDAPRPVGALRPAKTRRREPYTREDDIVLWRWVNDPKHAALAAAGNALYQQLEQVVRHASCVLADQADPPLEPPASIPIVA